jgi:hypothetical protein
MSHGTWARARRFVKLNRAFKLWRISGSKHKIRQQKYNQNVFLQFLLYLQHLDLLSVNPAMKKKVRKILTVSVFYLDPEVVFHTNDVTLNSSIEFSEFSGISKLLPRCSIVLDGPLILNINLLISIVLRMHSNTLNVSSRSNHIIIFCVFILEEKEFLD